MVTTELELADGARVRLTTHWLSASEQLELFERLRNEIAWKQETITIAGRRIQQPRLTAWYGEPEATYTYSGLTNAPLPWTEPLMALRRRVASATSADFNSVLLNLYRDGDDAMGMHADDERELGRNPLIASVSLGASRRFVVQHRRDKTDRRTLELPGGSLLIMSGSMQHLYKHGVPRQAGVGSRINLTFRRIFPRFPYSADVRGTASTAVLKFPDDATMGGRREAELTEPLQPGHRTGGCSSWGPRPRCSSGAALPRAPREGKREPPAHAERGRSCGTPLAAIPSRFRRFDEWSRSRQSGSAGRCSDS
jgi:alkylated DNA repair dioxygenase AlkB